MQEEKKTVDIDTSGPEVEVELPTNEDDKTAGEDKTHENERETKLEDNNQSDDSNKEFDKLPDVPVQEEELSQLRAAQERWDRRQWSLWGQQDSSAWQGGASRV